MKSLPSLFALFIVALMSAAISTPTFSAEFDPELARQTGADTYGMKPYVVAFLKAGPNRSGSDAEKAALQMAHLDNIKRLADEGLLVLAGPFLDKGELRGIYIFNVSDVETARELTQSDPAIQSGSLVMELKPWYGSAALMMVNDLHSKLAKKGI
ncbi:YciI family protein [Shewanella corallii]|uniref:YciI family protein n=1 Tax=Shewanella corallii TaxID=560080 RepID=A0ABT0NAT1_9GAMM|nr:YciI family protein [Shewanella corallii]MCL2914956.1 YciI family protein [Shewanella corallii]